MVNKQHFTTVTGDRNITGKYLNNVGNTNITISHPVGASSQPLTLESKVASGALLNSGERHPAPYCHPDTRTAVKKVVKDWIGRKGFGSEKRIMWISGPPGVGKSAILQTICEELTGENELDPVDSEDNSLVDACYFFGRGMGDREKASFFPATIAYQLVFSRTSCGSAIQKIVAKKPLILLESFPSQFRKLVLRPAKAHAASEAPITIVIDALDECDNVRDQVSLLNAIYEGATTANMRFVVASRPEEDIHAFFQRTTVSEHTYHIRLEGDFKASRDIEIFLRDKFAGIRKRRPGSYCRLPNGEEWPGSIVIYRLICDSDGQFIYPTLVIAFIDTSYPPPDQQLKSLLAAPPARAFSRLDALYHHILSRCPPELPAASDDLRDFQNLVMDILRVVVSWPLQLSITEIAPVLAKKVDVVQAVIHGPMCSLFKFDSTDLDSMITLCHKSLRDYLLDRLRSQQFFLQDADTPDRLYTQILSRRPPSDPSQSYSREMLMGVLSVVMARVGSVKVHQIASFLDVAPSVVQGVIFGPSKGLFKLSSVQDVAFSSYSFMEFLLDANRAGEYFIRRGKPLDTLFTQILSHQPPSDPSQSYFREVLMGVLTVVVVWGDDVTVPRIASLLDVAPSLVEGVVFGPTKALFVLDKLQNISFSIQPSFKDFLLDANRAREFFVYQDKIDSHFTRILSRQPPSDPSQSYSREVLMGVLSVVVALGGQMKVPQIASFLEVAPSVVEGIVFGPAKELFTLNHWGNVGFSIPSFREFLLDADRAGEYFIRRGKPLDTLFTQILSHQPPSDPSQSYFREVLMGVLTVVVVWGDDVTVPRIASLLDVAPSFVEGVVFGPAKRLFKLDLSWNIHFSIPSFKDFLLDANRGGEFFISRDKIDTLFTQILSRQPSSSLQPYSREVLMDVLNVLVVWSSYLSVAQIASTLDVDPDVVKAIVFGTHMFYIYPDGDVKLLPYVAEFLQDADRAGEYYIPPNHLNPNYDSMRVKIRKIVSPSKGPPSDLLTKTLLS